MPSTQRTLSTSTSLMVLLHLSSSVSSSSALTEHLNQLRRIMSTTKPSKGPNIRSALAALLHHDPCPKILALSPPAPAYPNRSPVQVKHKETPISLQTLRQSQSLRRVKKESRSPSLQFSVRLHRQLHSPPHQQSLTYVTLHLVLCNESLVDKLRGGSAVHHSDYVFLPSFSLESNWNVKVL